MSQDDKLREARSEIGQLRADLERVTAERDTVRRGLEDAQWRLGEVRHQLAETKAALERVTAERDDLQRQCAEWSDAVTTQILSHAETKAALEATTKQRDGARTAFFNKGAELADLQREWALHCLRFGHGCLDGVPESVAALIRAGAGCPIGGCERCGQRAPLVLLGTNHMMEQVHGCAPGWECSP